MLGSSSTTRTLAEAALVSSACTESMILAESEDFLRGA
jgi:hypothetical protein